jgi:uncharacterized protein YdeI (YjbR/CyaY-like superfamily)
MTPTFFKTPAELRRWFGRNRATCAELWIGIHKKDSGLPSVTYKEALDEALCFGWIDGVRRGMDDTSYCQRFTPRKLRSTWSAVNIARAHELIAEGRMQPCGLEAFERRTADRSRVYSYEQRQTAALSAAEVKVFKANRAAWTFFSAQAPSYRRTAAWWVQSAKQERTRARRLAVLIESSARGELAPPFIISRKPK